jgi:hypothetical protein
VDHAPDLGREREERGDMLPGVQQPVGEHGEPLARFSSKVSSADWGCVRVGRGVDRAPRTLASGT